MNNNEISKQSQELVFSAKNEGKKGNARNNNHFLCMCFAQK